MRTSPDSQCIPATLTSSSRILACPRGAECRVARVVELGSGVVRHAAVDRDPRSPGKPLDGTDAIQRHSRPADEAPSRLEPDLRRGKPRRDERFEGGGGRDARELGRFRHVVVGVVADPEAAAEVGDACLPAELVAAGRRERGEAPDRLRLRGEVGKLRADVDVEAEDVEAACERIRDGDACLRRWQAELRAVMPRDDRLVRVGVDTQRDADEDAPDARGCRERDLVGCVEHDRRVFFGGVAEQRVVLVVPVHDDLGSGEPGAARERELARRGHVGADALVAEQSQHGDVRKRLRSVEDTALRTGCRSQRLCPLPNRLLAVDDERRPESIRQLVGRHAADGKRIRVDPGRVREELEHRRILPGTVFGS